MPSPKARFPRASQSEIPFPSGRLSYGAFSRTRDKDSRRGKNYCRACRRFSLPPSYPHAQTQPQPAATQPYAESRCLLRRFFLQNSLPRLQSRLDDLLIGNPDSRFYRNGNIRACTPAQRKCPLKSRQTDCRAAHNSFLPEGPNRTPFSESVENHITTSCTCGSLPCL